MIKQKFWPTCTRHNLFKRLIYMCTYHNYKMKSKSDDFFLVCFIIKKKKKESVDAYKPPTKVFDNPRPPDRLYALSHLILVNLWGTYCAEKCTLLKFVCCYEELKLFFKMFFFTQKKIIVKMLTPTDSVDTKKNSHDYRKKKV